MTQSFPPVAIWKSSATASMIGRRVDEPSMAIAVIQASTPDAPAPATIVMAARVEIGRMVGILYSAGRQTCEAQGLPSTRAFPTHNPISWRHCNILIRIN
jgi:hypothetical protein